MIVCCEKPAFLQHLRKSVLRRPQTTLDGHETEADVDVESASVTQPTHPLLERTLRLLAVSRRVKLVFCPSVLAFHAYVATLPLKPQTNNTSGQVPTLVVLNLVRMHRTTASYSAQGLGKAFAATVETAWQIKNRPVFFEYPEAVDHYAGQSPEEHSDLDDEMLDGSESRRDRDGSSPTRDHGAQSSDNIWLDEVAILNATTKTFGNVGDRTWMGRTVKIGDVAARWCTFTALPEPLLTLDDS